MSKSERLSDEQIAEFEKQLAEVRAAVARYYGANKLEKGEADRLIAIMKAWEHIAPSMITVLIASHKELTEENLQLSQELLDGMHD